MNRGEAQPRRIHSKRCTRGPTLTRRGMPLTGIAPRCARWTQRTVRCRLRSGWSSPTLHCVLESPSMSRCVPAGPPAIGAVDPPIDARSSPAPQILRFINSWRIDPGLISKPSPSRRGPQTGRAFFCRPTTGKDLTLGARNPICVLRQMKTGRVHCARGAIDGAARRVLSYHEAGKVRTPGSRHPKE